MGKYPLPLLVLLTSLAAPLLSIVRATANFIVDVCGRTTTGKTTSLSVGASVWGNPAALVRSWSSTRVGIERQASLVQGLPVLLDESKVGHKKVIAEMIYLLANGVGKGRGSKQGLARTRTFRNLVLSTGEDSLTSLTEDEGTRARVLTFWGVPFPGAGADVLRALNQGVLEDYGHAGPQFVRGLLERRDEWPAWRERYRSLSEQYAAAAGHEPVAGRLAGYFALPRLAHDLAVEFGVLPACPDIDHIFEGLWKQVASGAGDADRAAVALERVYGWAVSNDSRFHRRAGGKYGDFRHSVPDDEDRLGTHAPPGGWAGRWDRPDEDLVGWKWIGFVPGVLRELLSGWGFGPDSTLRIWRDRGQLVTDTDGSRFTKQIRMAGHKVPLVVFPRSAFKAFETEDGDNGDIGGDTKE